MSVSSWSIPRYTEVNWPGERPPVCAYCSGKCATHSGCREYPGEIGIFSCDEHQSLANRDWRAELHNSRRLPISILLETFPEIKTQNISISRSDGSITANGYIISSDVDGDKFIKKISIGKWTIPVFFTIKDDGELYCKDVLLDDLVLSGMLEADVRKIIDTLDAGIFKTDYDAFMVARSKSATLSASGGTSANESAM